MLVWLRPLVHPNVKAHGYATPAPARETNKLKGKRTGVIQSSLWIHPTMLIIPN